MPPLPSNTDGKDDCLPGCSLPGENNAGEGAEQGLRKRGPICGETSLTAGDGRFHPFVWKRSHRDILSAFVLIALFLWQPLYRVQGASGWLLACRSISLLFIPYALAACSVERLNMQVPPTPARESGGALIEVICVRRPNAYTRYGNGFAVPCRRRSQPRGTSHGFTTWSWQESSVCCIPDVPGERFPAVQGRLSSLAAGSQQDLQAVSCFCCQEQKPSPCSL